MLVIRLNRVGRKNLAQFRIVVQEHTAAPSGRHIAIVGSYDPHTKAIILKTDEIKKYMANGAQPSDTVHNLLVREGVIDSSKRSVKMPDKKVEEGTEEKADTSSTEVAADKKEAAEEKVDQAAPVEEKEKAPAEKKTEEKKEKKEEKAPVKDTKSDKKEAK